MEDLSILPIYLFNHFYIIMESCIFIFYFVSILLKI